MDASRIQVAYKFKAIAPKITSMGHSSHDAIFIHHTMFIGASDEAVDLLPSPGIGADWTRDLPMDEGRDSDQIYQFDGTSNAVVIPPNVLNHNLTDTFSVSFWMRHEPPLDHTNKHIKEHIICNADDHSK